MNRENALHFRWVLSLLILSTACGPGEREPRGPAQERPTTAAAAIEPAKKGSPEVPAAGPAPSEPTLHLLRTTGSPSGPIPYELVEPASGAGSLPLVIGLHGRGDRAENFARIFERLRLPVRAVVGRAPIPWGQRGGRAWFDLKSTGGSEQVEEQVRALRKLIHHLRVRYPDAPPPILFGFSQGAMLSLQMLARHPEEVGGVIALSGFLPLKEQNITSARAVPTLLTMGEHDHLVTMARTREAAQALRELGHKPEELVFTGGHAIPREVLERSRTFIQELNPSQR